MRLAHVPRNQLHVGLKVISHRGTKGKVVAFDPHQPKSHNRIEILWETGTRTHLEQHLLECVVVPDSELT